MDSNILSNPSFLELDDAYRGMPRHGTLRVKTNKIAETLGEMEKIGFVAMKIEPFVEGDTSIIIRASKGKHGPCRFSGTRTKYTGVAMAALDDDLHLMPASQAIEVCDKTYAVHRLPAYEGLIVDASGREEAAGQQQEPDDHGDFDDTLGNIYHQLKDLRPDTGNRKMLFYPGPFRILILADGTMVRRGKWTAVPNEMATQLIDNEGLVPSAKVAGENAIFLQDKYRELGASALMDELNLEKQETTDYPTDLKSLDGLSSALKTRLLKLIDENKKYFVLVGSDMGDEAGCCPSEEVTEANRLVKKGILSAYSEPDQGEACPLTFFSIKGELTITPEGPEVIFNGPLRKKIRGRLVGSGPVWKQSLKWGLIVFVLISSVLAGRRFFQQQSISMQEVSYEKLMPLKDHQLQLVLFHNEKRCHQCLTMEAMALSLVEAQFGEAVQAEKLAFKRITIDDPVNQPMVKQLGIFAATLVFMEFESGDLAYARVLTRAVELYRDEAAFKKYLAGEIDNMLATP